MNHHIGIDASDPNGAPRLVLVCTATPGSDCRKRPADGRETWQFDDTDLVDGECWAAEWVDAAGWDDSVRADALDGTPWPRIPVTVHYDEGVIVAPIPPRYEAPDVAELRRLLDALPGFALKHLHGGPGGESYIALGDEGGMPLPDSGFDAVLIFAEIAALEVPRLLDRLAHMTEARDNARAEVARLTALVEAVRDWLDRRGVDVSDRDGAYMDGYRAAQRHALQDAAELRHALGGGAES